MLAAGREALDTPNGVQAFFSSMALLLIGAPCLRFERLPHDADHRARADGPQVHVLDEAVPRDNAITKVCLLASRNRVYHRAAVLPRGKASVAWGLTMRTMSIAAIAIGLMFRKRGLVFIAVWASILFAAPAQAAVTYTFTSDDGDFSFISPSFFGEGSAPGAGGQILSHSGDFTAVFFTSSSISLLSAVCLSEDNCFDATFLESGIFLRTGTFFASDGGAKIVISGSPTATPVPELSSWAMLAVGFAGLGLAMRTRRA